MLRLTELPANESIGLPPMSGLIAIVNSSRSLAETCDPMRYDAFAVVSSSNTHAARFPIWCLMPSSVIEVRSSESVREWLCMPNHTGIAPFHQSHVPVRFVTLDDKEDVIPMLCREMKDGRFQIGAFALPVLFSQAAQLTDNLCRPWRPRLAGALTGDQITFQLEIALAHPDDQATKSRRLRLGKRAHSLPPNSGHSRSHGSSNAHGLHLPQHTARFRTDERYSDLPHKRTKAIRTTKTIPMTLIKPFDSMIRLQESEGRKREERMTANKSG